MQTCIVLIFLLVSYSAQSLFAQSINNQKSGTEAFALAGASSTITNAFSILNNPASLVLLRQLNLATSANQLYGIEGFNQATLVISYSNEKLGLGLGVERFGDDLLNRSMIKAGIAHKIYHTAIAASCTLYQDYVQEFGYSRSVGVEISSLTKIGEQASLALVIRNPVEYSTMQQKFISNKLVLITGVSYSLAPNFKLKLDFQKPSWRPLSGAIGVRYTFREKWYFSAGINTDPMTQYLGTGFDKGRVKLRIGISVHPVLGLSGSTSISIRILRSQP